MNIQVSDINNFTKSIAFKIDSEVYQKTYDKTLKKLAKRVSLPGFRKGKVPAAMIEKNYQETVHSDTLDKIIQDSLRQACDDEKLEPIGNVKVEDLNFAKDKSLDFTVSFEVKPEIKDITYKNLKIRKDIRRVTDKEVDMVIEDMLLQRSKVIEAAPDATVQKGSFIRMNVQELDEKKVAKAGRLYKDMEIRIGDGYFDKKMEDQLIGLKVSESKQVSRKYPKNFEDKNLAGKSEHYEITVTHLEEREIPELNDEFVASLNEKSEIKTVDQLKEIIHKNLTSRYESESMNSFVRNAAEVILKKNPFDVPQTMVETYLDRLYQHQQSQQKVNEAKFKEARRESAIDEIRWELIKEFIIKEEAIRINDPDHQHIEVLEYIDSLAYSDQEKAYIKGNHKMIHDFEYQLLEKKLMDKIAESNKIDEQLIKIDQ
ncbi:MAG: trigger factor [Calditrichaeota bacterium]|nr:trigger factor [Calditrichota bacterium]